MRSIRPVLASVAFCLATSASIWIGWIYAGAGESPDIAPPSTGRPPSGGNESPKIGLPRDFGTSGSLPDMSNTNVLPGIGGPGDLGGQLNGFPTVSKEAIERASGYSTTDSQAPSTVLIPEKIGNGQGLDTPGFTGGNTP